MLYKIRICFTKTRILSISVRKADNVPYLCECNQKNTMEKNLLDIETITEYDDMPKIK